MRILEISIKRERFCMDKEYYMALAKVRMDRAQELLAESKGLLEKKHISLRIIEHFIQ